MAKFPFDLSRMKKIAQDDKSCTFAHKDGHSIKVATTALSPAVREQLSKLPLHKAEGGEANSASQGAALKENYAQDKKCPKCNKEVCECSGGEVRMRAAGSPSPEADPETPAADSPAQQPPSSSQAAPTSSSSADDDAWDSLKTIALNLSRTAGAVAGPAAHALFPQRTPDQIAAGQPAAPEAPAPQAETPAAVPSAAPAAEAPTAAATEAPTPEAEPDEGGEQDEGEAQDVPAASAAAPSAPQPAPPAAPAAPQSPMEQFQAAKTQAKGDLLKEDQDFAQDLVNGHITPETYQDLFAKKDTLGKVGTMFGLLFSGLGSGLSGQSNAVMNMMNTEIQNDLEAQKQSKANAQNFIRLNQDYTMQKAQIAKMQQEGKLTEAQAKQANMSTELANDSLSHMRANRAALHEQVLRVQKMPPGPQQAQAQQALAIMSQGVDAANSNLSDKAAAAQAYYQMLFGQPGQAPGGSSSGEQAFQARDQGLRALGPQGEARAVDLESKHFPGLQGQASAPLNGADREKLDSGIQFDRKLNNFIDWTKGHSGDLSPSDRYQGQALAAELQGAYRQATHGGVYKEGEQNFISKLIDSEPTKFFNNIRVLPQLSALADQNKQRVDQTAKDLGFPGYSGMKSAPAPQYKVVNGVKYMRGPNGEAVKVQ